MHKQQTTKEEDYDEMSHDHRLPDAATSACKEGKAQVARKHRRSRKKKYIALREVMHMLDEVSTRRNILHKENETVRTNLTSMQEALKSMPRAVQQERARGLMMNQQQQQQQQQRSDASSNNMRQVNESIRETLYAMDITVAASNASAPLSQQAFCNSLLTTVQHFPCGTILPLAAPAFAQQFPPGVYGSSSSAAAAPAPSGATSGEPTYQQ